MAPFALIVDPDPLWRESVESHLRGRMPTSGVSWLPEALDPNRDVPAGLLVVGPNAYVSIEDELAPALRGHPNLPVLLVVRQMEVDTLRVALHAGVRDVHPKTTPGAELAQAVLRLAESVVDTSGAAPGAQARGAGARLLAVCSPKGGSGVTTVATSLAMQLATETTNRVVLADLDPVFGDVPLLMGLPAPAVLGEEGLPDTIPLDELASQVVTHTATGVQVWCAQRSSIPFSAIPEHLLLETIGGLATLGDVLVLDVPAPIGLAAPLLVHADELFVVTAPDRASMKNVLVAYQLLHNAGLPPGRTQLVINRMRPGLDIEPESFEQIIGLPVSAMLPESPTVSQAVDQREPFIRMAPRDPAARALAQLTAPVAGRIG